MGCNLSQESMSLPFYKVEPLRGSLIFACLSTGFTRGYLNSAPAGPALTESLPAMRVMPLLLLLLVVAVAISPARAEAPDGYKLLYSQDLSDESALKEFEFTDPAAWRFTKESGGNSIDLFRQSNYKPAFRSPLNIALVAGKAFGDFVLEADLLSTIREYPHRDMCLFFGFESPTKFYYCHLGSRIDAISHNVLIVKAAPRLPITKKRSDGVKWGEGVWHHIRLERKLADGSIKLFFDDMKEPVMSAEDKTFGEGAIGFGSFDDTGKVRHIRIWGPSAVEKKSKFFSRK
jgi:hypothetical protein